MGKADSRLDFRKTRRRKKLLRLAQTLAAILVTLVMAFPLYWMFITSLKSGKELIGPTASFFPTDGIHWENYLKVFEQIPFFRYLFNTIYLTALTLVIQMGTGILAAYGFARGNFPLKNTLFILVLGALMIPHQVTFVPIYILVANLGWIDTFAGLVLPTSVSAYLIFMLRQNFMSVDQSYLDAGKIDGLGIIGTLRHILIPMCRSSVATVAFVTVMDGWNNYFWPKILSKTEQTRPISVGLVMLKNSFEQSVQSQNYNVVMAAVLVSMIPVVILFVLNQKNMLTGYSKAAMK